jgi:hypothetical protein
MITFCYRRPGQFWDLPQRPNPADAGITVIQGSLNQPGVVQESLKYVAERPVNRTIPAQIVEFRSRLGGGALPHTGEV